MIFTLSIEKPFAQPYQAVVSLAGEVVWNFTGENIEAILSKCTKSGGGTASFLVWYEHICIGTIGVSEMRVDPATVASRINSLCTESMRPQPATGRSRA